MFTDASIRGFWIFRLVVPAFKLLVCFTQPPKLGKGCSGFRVLFWAELSPDRLFWRVGLLTTLRLTVRQSFLERLPTVNPDHIAASD